MQIGANLNTTRVITKVPKFIGVIQQVVKLWTESLVQHVFPLACSDHTGPAVIGVQVQQCAWATITVIDLTDNVIAPGPAG